MNIGMKATMICAEDVNANSEPPRNESSVANAEIFKSSHPFDKRWSSHSISLNNFKSPYLVNAYVDAFSPKRSGIAMIPEKNIPEKDESKIKHEKDTSFMNGNATGVSIESIRTNRSSDGDVSTSKSTPRKKTTPVRLMRTPSALHRKRSCGSGSGSSMTDSKRLDEDLEELDAHLMNTTLRNIKYMHGSAKFTVFNDVAFQRDCLENHNKIRQLYGCPPLSWCQELADEAESWAQCVADRGRILYKELPGIGENISLVSANGSNHLPTGAEICELWANEVQHYDFSKPAWSERCQHFTQLVWKSTTEIGIARVWAPSKSLIAIVAFYAPSGNCNGINEFRNNVPAPQNEFLSLSSLLKK